MGKTSCARQTSTLSASKAALSEGLPPHTRHIILVSSLACKTTLRASVTCRKSINNVVHSWPQRGSALRSLPGLTSTRGPTFSAIDGCGCTIRMPPRSIRMPPRSGDHCSAWSFPTAVLLQLSLAGFYICRGGTSAIGEGNPACRCSQPGLAPPCRLAVHPPGSSPIPFALPWHFYFS